MTRYHPEFFYEGRAEEIYVGRKATDGNKVNNQNQFLINFHNFDIGVPEIEPFFLTGALWNISQGKKISEVLEKSFPLQLNC